jgi:hypothetical protein
MGDYTRFRHYHDLLAGSRNSESTQVIMALFTVTRRAKSVPGLRSVRLGVFTRLAMFIYTIDGRCTVVL